MGQGLAVHLLQHRLQRHHQQHAVQECRRSEAEAASRKSIDELEAKSADVSTAEANSKACAQANLLIAAWDTYGWILYREDKLDQAKPYLSAAWRASMRAEVGDHLAQIDEALGQKDEAATQYALAQSALTKNEAPDVRRMKHRMCAE